MLEARKYYRELGDNGAFEDFSKKLQLEVDYGLEAGYLKEQEDKPGRYKCVEPAKIPDSTSLCFALKVPKEIVTEEVKKMYSGMANGAFLYRWLSGHTHGMYWVNSFEATSVRTLKISQTTVQILLAYKRHQSLNKAKWIDTSNLIFPHTAGKLGDEKSDRLAFENLLKAAGVPCYQLYQLRKTAFTTMASQADLKTLMEFSGHSQVSTVIGNYVFATSESMKSAMNGMDKMRPIKA